MGKSLKAMSTVCPFNYVWSAQGTWHLFFPCLKETDCMCWRWHAPLVHCGGQTSCGFMHLHQYMLGPNPLPMNIECKLYLQTHVSSCDCKNNPGHRKHYAELTLLDFPFVMVKIGHNGPEETTLTVLEIGHYEEMVNVNWWNEGARWDRDLCPHLILPFLKILTEGSLLHCVTTFIEKGNSLLRWRLLTCSILSGCPLRRRWVGERKNKFGSTSNRPVNALSVVIRSTT